MREKYKNEIEELKELFKPICFNKLFSWSLLHVRSVNVPKELANIFFEVWGGDGNNSKEKSFYGLYKEINNK